MISLYLLLFSSIICLESLVGLKEFITMSKSKIIPSQRNRSQSVGLLLAAAVIPRTFQKSLMPRSDVDQSVITGITMAFVYMLGNIFQDFTELVAGQFLDTKNKTRSENSTTAINSSAVIGLVAIAAGYMLEKKYPYEPDEEVIKSTVRTTGSWLMRIGVAGGIIGAIEGVNKLVSDNDQEAEKRNLIPYFMVAGLVVSALDELRTQEGNKINITKSSLKNTKPFRTVGLGAGIALILAGIAYGERAIAKLVDQTVEEYAPYAKKSWLPIGHLIATGGMLFGLFKFTENIYQKIENNAENIEEGYLDSPSTELSSGGIKSAVKWNTLTIQGRRHIGSKLNAKDIESVMKEKSIEPIRIFVGLDSADSEEDRVAMALHELERTGAFKREVIVVVSPTGTGYINYIMSESFEYMSRGNVASVTIQYSKRPSPMSLDRVDEGYRQYRMLLNGIKRKLDTLPKNRRPRIVLFGESLGAWTSQNAFVNEGTDGLQYLGIDSALWIGTPAGSRWKDQVMSKKMLNSESHLVGLFDNFNDVKATDTKTRNKIRYVMLTHHNDPINQFGADVLVKQPEWIVNPNKRPKELTGKQRYRTPTLFIQMLFDMKNALKPIPGEFVANGHDYRADLAQFIKYVYRFKVTNEQLQAIEKQLRQNELDRAQKIELGIAETTS